MKLVVQKVDNGFIIEAGDTHSLAKEKSVVSGFDYEDLGKELERRFTEKEKKDD